ncbi:MAG: AAA family ATPase, partial [Chloroflexi bacterium]|nr:AAA family ATPase [Chloroflexota bacterium]
MPCMGRRAMYKSFRVKNFRCFKDLQINDLGRVNLIAGQNNTGKTALLEAMYLFTKPLTPQVLFHLNYVRGLNVPSDNLPAYWQQFFYRMDSNNAITIAVDNTERASGSRLSIIEREFTKEVLDLLTVQFTRQHKSLPMGEILSEIATTDLLLELTYTWDRAPDNYKIIFSPIFLSESAKEFEEKSEFIPTKWQPSSAATANQFSQLEFDGLTPRLPDALSIFEPDLADLNLLSTHGQVTIWASVGGILQP